MFNPFTIVLPAETLTYPKVSASNGLNVKVCGLEAELYVADNFAIVAALTGFVEIAPVKGGFQYV